MNSYPPELLTQLAPVMFVAGLDATSTSSNQSTKSQDFTTLTLRLREALQAQRKVAFWQCEKTKTFHISLVDKDVKFPPRKLVPPDDPQFTASHSPLSPLTPTSPLFPDGLIAPIWLRKHTTLLPSVFVLFTRIFEFPPHNPHTPLDVPGNEREREREQEERRRDTELAAEVALRKKSTSERGIKLTLVLMASRKMLDDPTLDARLSYIRRQSGLDSRAALFVLSPVSPGELSEFVKSLQQALYDPALEYYTAHSKRVRRKRNRHSQVTSYPNPGALGSTNVARPLRPEGWTVRYECKMACFAEFRGEDEVALKHYQDAHNTLVVMFGSTAILPPRTKRWAEAKVLADCINIKIAKLYLYNNEHSLALAHHNTHMRLFSDFSRGWGIGEETFEFWSWMARQHRVLAELLEQGMRSTLTIPVHKSTGAGLAASQAQNTNNLRGNAQTTALELESMRSLGINPSHALQHPGFYYYMAAKCTEMRRERFLMAMEAEHSPQTIALSPGFVNEKKIDHLAVILELYTKSYELFKKYTTVPSPNATQGRLTLWIAYRIAQTHYDSGKFDMAIRFFERIAKTYHRERWYSMLRPLLSTWYACAQQLGDVELSVKLLVEQLAQDFSTTKDPNALEEDLLNVLKSTVPSSDTVLSIDISDSPIFNSNIVFWTPEVKVGESAAFQLSLAAPLYPSMSSIPFSSLAVYFSHRSEPVVVWHSNSATTSPSLSQIADLGLITVSEAPEIAANLRWQPGSCITFTGVLLSDVPVSIKVSKLVLLISEASWNIELVSSQCGSRQGLSPVARWLSAVDPPRYIPVKWENSSSVNFRHRPHDLAVNLAHQPPAYLNENYPITIDVTNADNREFEVVVDVLLPPTEIDGAVNTIVLDNERSSGFIKGVSFGMLAPGAQVLKTLYLVNTGAAGNRMVDISVQSRSTSSEESDDTLESQDVTENLQTLLVPTVDPIEISHTVAHTRPLNEWHGLADLRSFDADFWDDRCGGEALISSKLVCVGQSEIEIESIRLEREDHKSSARVISCSADDDDEAYPSDYFPGDELAHLCRIAYVRSGDEDPNNNNISSPGSYHISWRRIQNNGERGLVTTSVFPLPSLSPPVEGLLALLSAPPTATLHVPVVITLTIRNYYSSKSANVAVQLELDSSDGFVIAGLRSARVPILMPGAEEKLVWNLVPIECGYVKMPRIRVTNIRSPTTSDTEAGTEELKGETVKVIDARLHHPSEKVPGAEESSILVLP